MTYNRMEAKAIAGEHCRFCGRERGPLVKTRCCEQWICCDTAFVSFRGGRYCQFEHENESACYFHYNGLLTAFRKMDIRFTHWEEFRISKCPWMLLFRVGVSFQKLQR